MFSIFFAFTGKMFFSEFGSILDIYTWHFISAVGVSFVAIIITFLLSRTMIIEGKDGIFHGLSTETASETDKVLSEKTTDGDQKRGLKNSPAVVAERVIRANMTEEQKTLEQQVRQKQLREIFKLMQKETEKFGDISLNELEEQMRMYQ